MTPNTARFFDWTGSSTTAAPYTLITNTSTTCDTLTWTSSSPPIVYVPIAPPLLSVQWAAPTPAPSPPRGFNLYLNAFDLLAAFTEEARAAGVRRRDFVRLPVELFVTWLLLKSAEFEGVDPPEGTPKALPFPAKARCLDCGRFLSETNARLAFPYCGTGCLERRRGKLG